MRRALWNKTKTQMTKRGSKMKMRALKR